ncbi:MAG TPA: NUDIX hydrolase [Thermoleophilaceae bacterium]|nr:NUDIX hydrolase [Actinomycetota bacterium]HYN51702.1 NUDIX hydrolase [Thermoleophilaceae bacterium]
MKVDRPPPGEQLNEGEVTPARQAATLVLLRDGPEGPQVLLVQRNPKQHFMGGAWVFPGGALHDDDADLAAAAVRELAEEAGIELPADTELVPWSRWITPEEVKVRFDTWFFVAEAPSGAEATPDGGECVDARWLRPAAALDAHLRDELMLVFPTIKHLEALAAFDSVRGALDAARRREVVPIQPRVVVRDGSAEVLLPGEPGYDHE